MGGSPPFIFFGDIMARFTNSVTKTEICNLALSKLGSDRIQLANFADDTGQVKEQCDLFFLPSLEELTRMYSWNCCKKRSGSISADANFDGEYNYSTSYSFPTDCIRVLGVERNTTDEMSTGSNTTALEKNDFIVLGRKIYCNITTGLYLHYLAIPEDEVNHAYMDASFLKCFYTFLAMKLAVPLTGNSEVENAIRSEFYKICLPEAKRLNSIEGDQAVLVDEEYNELPIDAFNHKQFGRV